MWRSAKNEIYSEKEGSIGKSLSLEDLPNLHVLQDFPDVYTTIGDHEKFHEGLNVPRKFGDSFFKRRLKKSRMHI